MLEGGLLAYLALSLHLKSVTGGWATDVSGWGSNGHKDEDVGGRPPPQLDCRVKCSGLRMHSEPADTVLPEEMVGESQELDLCRVWRRPNHREDQLPTYYCKLYIGGGMLAEGWCVKSRIWEKCSELGSKDIRWEFNLGRGWRVGD